MKDEGSRLKAEADDETELDLPTPVERCRCLRKINGRWFNIGSDRIALFYPFKGYSAKKHCPRCGGTGLFKAPEPLIAGGEGRTAEEVEHNVNVAAWLLIGVGCLAFWVTVLHLIGVF